MGQGANQRNQIGMFRGVFRILVRVKTITLSAQSWDFFFMVMLGNLNRGAENVDSWIESELKFCQTYERKRQVGKRVEEIIKTEVKVLVSGIQSESNLSEGSEDKQLADSYEESGRVKDLELLIKQKNGWRKNNCERVRFSGLSDSHIADAVLNASKENQT